MTQAEKVNELLRLKPYRSLGSPRLKPTPDLNWRPASLPPASPDEIDEDKLILEYEQRLQNQKAKRGY